MTITYSSTLQGVAARQLAGFFVGWPRHPTPELHLEMLKRSSHVVIAAAEPGNRVVGFINAISDGVLSAHIPLLEVLPEYQGRGIGQELLRRILDQLKGLYAIDLLCDPDKKQFYARMGMTPGCGMMVRNYERQAGSKPA